MPTSFPTNLDSYTDTTPASNRRTDSLSARINNLQDAVEATETKVGPNTNGSYTGSSTVDSVAGTFTVSPSGNDTSAIIVKSPNSSWGVSGETAPAGDPLYATGQFLQFEKEGVGTTSDNVLFRVDRTGGVGTGGGVHIATGLRQRTGYTVNQAVWIDPTINTVGLVIHNPTVAESATWDKDFVQIFDTRSSANAFRVDSAGHVLGYGDVSARVGAATQVKLGTIFGVAGVGFGSAVDTTLSRLAAGDMLVANRFTLIETTDPAAPAANRGTIYMRDNGSGKTQFVVRFPTGAVQVLATEP